MTASKQKGFTLIEILIAIFILAIVLSTVYAAYTGTFRVIKDTEYGDDIYSMARSAMKRMIEDLESVCKHEDAFKFTSERNEINGKEFTNISFLSSAHLNFDDESPSGIATINYYIEEDNEKEGYLLLREDLLNKGEKDEETERKEGFILCDRLQSLTYKFYDGKGNEYDLWDSDSEDQKNIAPSVVSIHLAFINPDDKDDPYRFMTKVFCNCSGR